jgi:hypothetical protein
MLGGYTNKRVIYYLLMNSSLVVIFYFKALLCSILFIFQKDFNGGAA